MIPGSRLLVFALDILFIVAAYLCAFLLRFDFDFSKLGTSFFLYSFYLVLLVKPLVFFFSSMYRSIWQYASLQDAVKILKTVFLSSLMVFLCFWLSRGLVQFSRSIFIMDFILLAALMTASRLFWRVYRESWHHRRCHKECKTLIVGAGEAGSILVKEIWKQPKSNYDVVGFVDDDSAKHRLRLHGLPILGGTDCLDSLIKKHDIENVIIAMPSAGRKKIRDIVRSCEQAKVHLKILPGLGELINGTISISHVKDVEIEDLLGREPVVLDNYGIRGYLSDKTVLVTGGAGSIGSELCRQIARFKPYKLVIFDSAETSLFYMERELAAHFPNLRLIAVLGDIRNLGKVEQLFAEFKPEVVFHAAAYKHVPMMEYNPAEAVSNNILGTRVLVDVASRSGVANFVMVSTDKAVNPTNVMGATKRAAERYVQALAGRSSTRFTTVRFGNVLGSSGSVIPLFKEQIRNGGPVTVTDPQVIRYFMTIPEASQLVLQAGCLGNSGEIFVLDMGEPVRIVELAEELVRLSGLVPYEDIDIIFTGLRPGEKLFEEILIEGEGVRPTPHDKIKVLAAMPTERFDALAAELDVLQELAANADIKGLMCMLKRVVPEFNPQYAFKDQPPYAFRRVRPDIYPENGSSK